MLMQVGFKEAKRLVVRFGEEKKVVYKFSQNLILNTELLASGVYKRCILIHQPRFVLLFFSKQHLLKRIRGLLQTGIPDGKSNWYMQLS